MPPREHWSRVISVANLTVEQLQDVLMLDILCSSIGARVSGISLGTVDVATSPESHEGIESSFAPSRCDKSALVSHSG